jgi:8-oxo-dGTP pyrophosphatase MutT (NUDIX family)
MVAGALLPVAIHNNKLYFLFGKENPMEDSSRGWSDFGGGCEKGEHPYQTALREGSEELTGFFGDRKKLDKMVKSSKGLYTISHNDYHSHLFLIDYDEDLPFYFNQNHRFLWERMNQKMLNDSKLFEKIEIQWFSETELKTKREVFRHFYKEIVDKIVEELPAIRNHMKNHIRTRIPANRMYSEKKGISKKQTATRKLKKNHRRTFRKKTSKGILSSFFGGR